MPTIISGTIALLNAASKWILLIAPLTGSVFGGYHAIKKSTSDDDMEIKKHEKMIKNAIVGVVVAMTVSGIITFVTGYYK